MITIALSKGRLAEQAIDLLEKAGYDVNAAREKSRKLILEDPKSGLRFILAKPADVPTYVEYGAADIGVVGKDTLLEEGRQLYEVIDLGFGRCRMCVAGPKELEGKLDMIPNKRVGTKYPNITRAYFEGVKNESVEIIKLNGSVELAPLIGLSEVIVDIVESGRTLYENGLEVLETVADISARVVVNRVSMRMKSDEIKPMIDRLREQVAIMNAEGREDK
ncbi:MAG: ATP phosphoribosyltransferase [Mageeibacillus sp.]|nr:ATP phosphoribosyltransferase [Mageeibacillus sp.]MCI1264375.1 ATP phosphoribosyltransferase [Saccharofermentans sp.]MCI1769555.1 ATP phosphoribosyltransferase [Mageeibacillus sp.]MCI2044356.1 ATP phosphoribosyltransferase [Mageeibacillus sp.]